MSNIGQTKDIVSTKLVSVIIPSFKRVNLLNRAIISVLTQTYTNIELIIVDDNDPDSIERRQTEELINSINDHRINYIKHDANFNGAVARNTGLKIAKGDFITFLDNDDYYDKNKIFKQVEKLNSMTDDYNVCYTFFTRVNDGKVIDYGQEYFEGYAFDRIIKAEIYLSAGSNIMFDKKVSDGLYFNENLKRRQDLDFLLKLLNRTYLCCVPEKLIFIDKADAKNSLKSITELEENLTEFLVDFDPYIKNLSTLDKAKLIKNQKLINSRMFLNKRNFPALLSYLKANDISYVLYTRYLFYLVNRKILKKCSGFKI